MAGCGQCPDVCNCTITDENGVQYDGAGTPLNPIVIPRAQNTPWQGTSDDGSITITPGDVVDPNDDGHAPDFAVNFCALVEEPDVEDGDILVVRDEDENCRPHRLRDPLPGEFMGRHPETGRAAWVQGAVIAGGEVPFGVPLEFWGDEASVPANYSLCDFSLIPIASAPALFAVIGFNASGGVDPGGGMFHVPDKRGYTTAGRDNMGGVSANRLTDPNADVLGGTLGAESVAIAVGNLPAHTHPLAITGAATGVTVNNTTTAISVNGAATGVSIIGVGDHSHTPGTAGRSFVTAEDATLVQVRVSRDAGAVAPDRVDLVVDQNDGNAEYGQKNNNATSSNGAHSHGVSDPGHGHTTNNPAHGHTTNDPGHTHVGTANANANQTNTPLSVVQPTQVANYIIRLY